MRNWTGPASWALMAGVGLMFASETAAEQPWVTYDGGSGPGAGKHVVLISGDEEYRTEESYPQLGKILAEHHGFRCTVLFAVDPEMGEINPNMTENIPGTEVLETADLMIIGTRFRNLPDEQMRPIDDYINAGKPVLGTRTATHAFNIPEGREYHRYSFNYGGDDWPGGFGRQVLGETWISHHGAHGQEATRGVVAPEADDHPILNGIGREEIFCTTDVYEVRLPLVDGAQPLVMGQVLSGMEPGDEPVEDGRNDPMMPVAWTLTYTAPEGASGRAFATTMGTSEGLLNEGLRRLLVNATYYLLDIDVPEEAEVAIVGEYDPSPFAFDGFREGVKPADHAME